MLAVTKTAACRRRIRVLGFAASQARASPCRAGQRLRAVEPEEEESAPSESPLVRSLSEVRRTRRGRDVSSRNQCSRGSFDPARVHISRGAAQRRRILPPSLTTTARNLRRPQIPCATRSITSIPSIASCSRAPRSSSSRSRAAADSNLASRYAIRPSGTPRVRWQVVRAALRSPRRRGPGRRGPRADPTRSTTACAVDVRGRARARARRRPALGAFVPARLRNPARGGRPSSR